MRASVALPSSADAAATVTAWLSRITEIAERRRWWIVGLCIVGQWAFLWHHTHTDINHNGWIFQHGDDGPWYWTTAWAQTTLHVPFTAVGPGWPYILTPLAAIFGPNMANGLPAVIALNVLVLAPASVIGMYLIAERIAGRLFGVWTAVLWTLMPTIALALYSDSSRHVIVDSFLPTATGLNALSDYPSMVLAIFCGYLVLRSMENNDLRDGVLCGVMLGFLVLIKPANGPMVLAAVVALGVTLRLRALLGTVVAAVPAAVALSIWKKTGTGQVPVISSGGGGGGGSSPGAAVAQNTNKYLNIDVHHLAVNVQALGQTFWSVRLLEFLLVAGAFGLIARGRWKGAFVVGWFISFGLIKGTVTYSNVYDTSLYRFLLPAWPAWTLIVAGVVYCWPTGMSRRARRVANSGHESSFTRTPGMRTLVGAGVVLSLAPLLLVLAVSPAKRGAIVDQNFTGAPVAAVDFGLRAQRTGPHTIRLEWRSMKTSRAETTYAIFKAADDGCVYSSPDVPLCRFKMQLIGTAHDGSFVDSQAVTRRLYRVGLVAGSTVQVDNPSLLLVSRPLTVNAG